MIKQRTKDEIGLTCSVGVAYSKTAAKTASEEKKPNGYYEIPTAKDFVDLIIDRDVRVIYTVGEMTAEKLYASGIRTVRGIQENQETVISLLGKQGQWITRLAFGIDDRRVTPCRLQDAKSISREVTFQEDVNNFALSMAEKGIKVIYRASQYKKKVRLIVNTGLLLGDSPISGDKLVRKLGKRIGEYFGHRYRLDDFSLSGMGLTADINVGTRENVSAYLKVMQRVGKVKGFSPSSYDGFGDCVNFCLSGNSNGIDFLLYDLEGTIRDRLTDAEAGQKKLKSVSEQTKGILRVEVRLTKPKAIWAYTDADDVPGQIMELTNNRATIFMDTFARIVPFGNFYKKDAAMEIIRKDVKDNTMRRKMLRLLVLIPEKKSLHLAQKAAGFRDVEKVMEVFVKINLSPVTLSKRHKVNYLQNIYSYM